MVAPRKKVPAKKKAARLRLPKHEFFYTLQQICAMLEISQNTLRQYHLYIEGTTKIMWTPKRMRTINVGGEGRSHRLRVSEKEFRRWLTAKGMDIYE